MRNSLRRLLLSGRRACNFFVDKNPDLINTMFNKALDLRNQESYHEAEVALKEVCAGVQAEV